MKLYVKRQSVVNNQIDNNPVYLGEVNTMIDVSKLVRSYAYENSIELQTMKNNPWLYKNEVNGVVIHHKFFVK